MASVERLVAGISYCLSETAKKDGNSCLPLDALKNRAEKLLSCTDEKYQEAFEKAIIKREIVIREYEGTSYAYLAYLDSAERYTARITSYNVCYTKLLRIFLLPDGRLQCL